ncbi:hypothetical protein J5X84_36120 [Streptosporangiaceae bacterium NEAU-GS5]|nr:hypothetical protein [Streptosporangiaceae bacterium NEAU-GS5]
MRHINRIPPKLPVTAVKTYAILSPHDTAVKSACETVGCKAWRQGWTSLIDESTDLGRAQASYIRHGAGRTFREQRTAEGLTAFRFDSGQRCFRDHLTYPEVYLARGGDWRGNPRGERRLHTRPADWVEDFGLHQQRLNDAQQRG